MKVRNPYLLALVAGSAQALDCCFIHTISKNTDLSNPNNSFSLNLTILDYSDSDDSKAKTAQTAWKFGYSADNRVNMIQSPINAGLTCSSSRNSTFQSCSIAYQPQVSAFYTVISESEPGREPLLQSFNLGERKCSKQTDSAFCSPLTSIKSKDEELNWIMQASLISPLPNYAVLIIGFVFLLVVIVVIYKVLVRDRVINWRNSRASGMGRNDMHYSDDPYEVLQSDSHWPKSQSRKMSNTSFDMPKQPQSNSGGAGYPISYPARYVENQTHQTQNEIDIISQYSSEQSDRAYSTVSSKVSSRVSSKESRASNSSYIKRGKFVSGISSVDSRDYPTEDSLPEVPPMPSFLMTGMNTRLQTQADGGSRRRSPTKKVVPRYK